jgi:predicted RNase H-like nuclease
MSIALIGIDGCKGGWVAASSDQNLRDVRFAVLPDLREVFERARRGEAMVIIDIPIGLSDSEPRQCDIEARKILIKRHKSSVFPAPARRCLVASGRTEYLTACALSREACGKSLSKQAHAILSKILEVDELMTPELQARAVREAHPEVTFAMLAGQGLLHSKKKPAGEQERLDLLGAHGCDIDLDKIRLRLGRGTTKRDDIVDAAACLVTAHAWRHDRLTSFPVEVRRDSRGLKMEIVAPMRR